MTASPSNTVCVDDDLDRPIYGAEAIGRAAGLLNDDGSTNLRATYDGLEKGYIDANKFGLKKWVSTKRRARRHASSGTTA
jgi:hypothetical protein